MDTLKKRGDLPLLYRYNRAWAGIVVKKFLGRYARAAEILGAVLGLHSSYFSELLALGSPLWPLYRDCIKYLHKWGLRIAPYSPLTELHKYTTHLYSTLETSKGIYRLDYDDLTLTELRTWLRINSQGVKGGTRGGKTPRQSPHYMPRKEMEYTRK